MSKKNKNDHDGKIAGLYDLEDTIGRGHFAVVKLARHVFTGEKVAVKVIDKTKLDEVSKAHLFQEVRCMKLVQHPNVVRLYEVIDTQTKLYLILELGDGGDLYDYIMKHEGGLKEPVARTYFRQIVEAISYCHKLHVVHRDLKPENVVFFEKLGLVKLTDFGFSNMFNPGYKLETSCGSLAYSAPEILLGDSYDAPAVDVWSLGVILYMLVCGTPPFQEANDSETLTMIMDCKYQIPSHISSQCRDLINKMLKREPSKRASLGEIMTHPWLVGGELLPMSYMPLISREHISEEDHNYLVQRMVEGKIATREEILSSLDKGSYNHITATYYLLAERRLKRHQHYEQQLGGGQQRKPSIPNASQASTKPHLEPLSLSPRKLKGAKKTKTAPLGLGLDVDTLTIKPLQGPSSAEIGSLSRPLFVKSITGTMTLDRKDSLKKRQPHSISPVSPDIGHCRLDTLKPKTTESKEAVKKKSTPFSKIAILSSFFERKAAAAAAAATATTAATTAAGVSGPTGKSPGSPDCTPGTFWKGASKKRQNSETQTKEPMKPSYIQSLLSPPGTHPAPVLSPPSRASPDSRLARKYSLIKEDSQEENMEDPEEEIGEDIHVQPVRTFEDVEEKVSARNLSEDRQDGLTVRWPLVSVASSPQLLNQIFEENESDEDDDFVPDSLHVVPTTYGAAHASMASPEILRKYEQRKKRRGGGQRGASCSSSDASDTDDTAEGRSRKDKLKHKFVHRRDSSDHSSDTDGPSGGGGNLGSGGGHYSGSGSSSNSSKDGSKKPAGKKDGGGKGSKGGGGGGGGGGHKSKQHQVSVDNIGINVDSQKLIKKLNEINMASLMPNSCSRSPRIVSEPGDSLREKNFMFGCSQVQYLGQSDSDRQAEAKSFRFSEISSDQSDVAEVRVSSCLAVCSPDCVLVHKKGPKLEHKIKRDINSNGFPPRCCQPDVTPSMSTLKVESKCCSVV